MTFLTSPNTRLFSYTNTTLLSTLKPTSGNQAQPCETYKPYTCIPIRWEVDISHTSINYTMYRVQLILREFSLTLSLSLWQKCMFFKMSFVQGIATQVKRFACDGFQDQEFCCQRSANGNLHEPCVRCCKRGRDVISLLRVAQLALNSAKNFKPAGIGVSPLDNHLNYEGFRNPKDLEAIGFSVLALFRTNCVTLRTPLRIWWPSEIRKLNAGQLERVDKRTAGGLTYNITPSKV